VAVLVLSIVTPVKLMATPVLLLPIVNAILGAPLVAPLVLMIPVPVLVTLIFILLRLVAVEKTVPVVLTMLGLVEDAELTVRLLLLPLIKKTVPVVVDSDDEPLRDRLKLLPELTETMAPLVLAVTPEVSIIEAVVLLPTVMASFVLLENNVVVLPLYVVMTTLLPLPKLSVVRRVLVILTVFVPEVPNLMFTTPLILLFRAIVLPVVPVVVP
jgi:hypothetical protein